MKKLIAICIITLTLAALSNIASAVPVTNDLWDTDEGATVTASSGTRNWASNMFGTNGGGYDAYVTLFNDGQPAGTEHWVQWRTADTVTLGSFKLYAAHDGAGGPWGDYGRSFDHFSLFAKDLGTGVFTLIYETAIAVPYEFIGGETGFLAQHTFAAPIIAQDFKAIFRQHGAVTWAEGPRIIELDGFVPEPATVCLLGLGALSLIRRKR